MSKQDANDVVAAELQERGQCASPLCADAVCNLVAAKDRLDDWGQGGSLLWAHANARSVGELAGYTGTINPWTFAISVLPFIEDEHSEAAPAWVPLDRVIGEPVAWRSPDDRRSSEDLAAYLLHPERASTRDSDCAEVIEIDPIGLFIAHEGKNRIRFLRDRSASWLPARVSRRSLPAASRIAVYTVDDGLNPGWWAVVDERWVYRLRLPDLTLPLLQAYGVGLPQAWPAQWPSPGVVIEAFRHQRRGGRMATRVDLAPLLAEAEALEAARTSDKRVAVFDVLPLTATLPLLGIVLVACLVGGGLQLDVWPSAIRMVGIGLFGAGVGGLAVLGLPVLTRRAVGDLLSGAVRRRP